ncbi:MAG TPA: putative toxin-antitoxin system toxin component, PIN family [Solirubrobacterales bacterium]|nr:putative toxin-antitoxin system toxin component, PIN family [Solirubrobacterales bacterium]
MKRLVVDANSLASGIVDPESDKPPRLLFEAIRNVGFEPVVCPKLLEELRRTLRQPYFRERIGTEEARKAVAQIERAAIRSEDPAKVDAVLRDRNDDYLLALAREVSAEAIVTGDKDLLEHAGELEVAVLSAREACELLGLGKEREPEEAAEHKL